MATFPDILPFQPIPIQLRIVKAPVKRPEFGLVPVVEQSGIYRVWVTSEGERCRLCPRHVCTLTPVVSMPGVSTCIQVVKGDISLAAAATLRLD